MPLIQSRRSLLGKFSLHYPDDSAVLTEIKSLSRFVDTYTKRNYRTR